MSVRVLHNALAMHSCGNCQRVSICNNVFFQGDRLFWRHIQKSLRASSGWLMERSGMCQAEWCESASKCWSNLAIVFLAPCCLAMCSAPTLSVFLSVSALLSPLPPPLVMACVYPWLGAWLFSGVKSRPKPCGVKTSQKCHAHNSGTFSHFFLDSSKVLVFNIPCSPVLIVVSLFFLFLFGLYCIINLVNCVGICTCEMSNNSCLQ